MELELKYYDYGYLPPHILVDILSRLKLADLKSAVLTCKSWYSASYDRKITKKILINGLTDSSCIDYLKRPVHNIRLSNMNSNKFNFRKLFRKFGHGVKDLDILFTKFALTRVYEIFIYLPNVETVKIHIVANYYSPQNFNSFKRIVQYRDTIANNLKRIKFLTINMRLNDFKPLYSFISQCVNVDKLVWNEWMCLPSSQIGFLCDFLLEPSQNPMMNNLTDLLIGCVGSDWCSHILNKMANVRLPKLKRLHFKDIDKHNYDIAFREFCKVYHNLQELAVNGCNDQQLLDICKYMTNLESLAIHSCVATNFEVIANLAQLKSLLIFREDAHSDDKLLMLLNMKSNDLTKLNLNLVNEQMFKFICEKLPRLEHLVLDGLDTKDCELVFRHLTKLKVLTLTFMDRATCHSSRLQSCDVYNITRLTELQELYVSCWVPGITPTLVRQLPNHNTICLYTTYDPTEEEFAMWRLEEEEQNEQCTTRLDEDDMIAVCEIFSDDHEGYNVTDFNLDLFHDSNKII